MTRTLLLLGIATLLAWPVRLLCVRARWMARAPRAAIALWQAIALAFVVATLGACVELASLAPAISPRREMRDFNPRVRVHPAASTFTPGELFGLTAALIVGTLVIGALVTRVIGQLRVRAEQRVLLDLVGEELPGSPGALVLKHPLPAAYGVPGLHARVVVSSGAIEVLAGDELAAVIAHERAHLRARHGLVLLPFHTLTVALPRSRAVAAVDGRVRGLVEMAADDRAIRECGSNALARALCRLSSNEAALPANTVGTHAMVGRVERVVSPRRSAKLAAFGSGLTALGVVALPLVATFLPLGGR